MFQPSLPSVVMNVRTGCESEIHIDNPKTNPTLGWKLTFWTFWAMVGINLKVIYICRSTITQRRFLSLPLDLTMYPLGPSPYSNSPFTNWISFITSPSSVRVNDRLRAGVLGLFNPTWCRSMDRHPQNSYHHIYSLATCLVPVIPVVKKSRNRSAESRELLESNARLLSCPKLPYHVKF